MDESNDAQIRFTVLRGRPDAVELAALTAVLCACLRAPGADQPGEDGTTTPAAPWGGTSRRRPRVGWATRT
ncbi:acyl-CoA carboxylase subunit epsilon [Streptomyces sp. NPDC056773]|uniref:acyl-CoA carboxylase subunit epsilon n=1 Tax=unclassified Streptomyces TaxID=2593676 RepID=UPI003696126A